ncbi:two-component sensor histidine kinase [Rhizobium sp. BK251]|nr:two-component sensor histidine kinase [Rhizobium sp. BK251]
MLEDLYRLLKSGHVQAQGVVDTMTQPVVVLDRNLSVTTANNAFIKTFAVDRDDVLGQSLFDLGNGQWEIPELRHLIESVIPKAAAVVGYEVKHDFPSIGQRTFLVDARRLVQPDDNSSSLLVIFDDVTERQRQSAEQEFIIAETRHRMRNLFAVVRAIAMQTIARSADVVDYRDTFLARLEVALRAQELAANRDTITFDTLLRQAVGELGAGRLETHGPPVQLGGAKVLSVSMIFHELATNAAKYGALTVHDGKVTVTWTVETGPRARTYLSCQWRESNGPRVVPAEEKGYGTELIEGMSAQLGGTSELKYEHGGLVATIRIPL